MAKSNTADIGFEDKIWKAADLLRGSIDAAEYKNVVLGLIFLKYISDCFDVKHQQLVDEGDGFEEDKDEYVSENIFYVPSDARWSVIAEAAHTPEIGKVIDNAMMEIEKENDRLKGILPKNFARPELDKRRLGDVVDLFTNTIELGKQEENKDLLGRTTNTASLSSPRSKARTQANSTRPAASSAPSWPCCSHTKAAATTRPWAVAACLSKVPTLCAIIKATSRT